MKIFFLNKKMLFAVLTIFIFVFGIQMVEPSAAAKTKLVSKGSKNFYFKNQNTKLIYSWKIYKQGKSMILISSSKFRERRKNYNVLDNGAPDYNPNENEIYYYNTYYEIYKYKMKKLNKNKIKVSVWNKLALKDSFHFMKTHKVKWKKSALQYTKYQVKLKIKIYKRLEKKL